MLELGQLNDRHDEFEKRNSRIVAVSMDEKEFAKETKQKFRHLTVLADPDAKLIEAIKAVAPHAGEGGADTAAPTTIIIDSAGKIRWVHREERFISRPSPGQVLAAFDNTVND